MQDHAEDIHSRPRPRCPNCNEALAVGETVCRNCGAKIEPGDFVVPGAPPPNLPQTS